MKEMQRAFQEFEKSLGPKGHISIFFESDPNKQPFFIGVYTDWPSGGMVLRLYADSLEMLLLDLHERWADKAEEIRVQTIERMALKIIEWTAFYGECTDAALRPSFGDRVAELGAEACARADEIAGKGPFKIVSAGASNHD